MPVAKKTRVIKKKDIFAAYRGDTVLLERLRGRKK